MTNPPNTLYPFLTRVRGRNRYEKLHTNLGAAKNAVNGVGGSGQIYEWVDGGWKLLYDETGRPYSWQISALEKERKDTERRIENNRAKAEAQFHSDASELWTPQDGHKASFVLGYVTALMALWDKQPEYTRASRF